MCFLYRLISANRLCLGVLMFFLVRYTLHPKWLYTPQGRYKGYPYRTARRGPYLNGYSDHFPVYAILSKAEGN